MLEFYSYQLRNMSFHEVETFRQDIQFITVLFHLLFLYCDERATIHLLRICIVFGALVEV